MQQQHAPQVLDAEIGHQPPRSSARYAAVAARAQRHRCWFWLPLSLIAVGDLATKAWIFAGPNPSARWAHTPFIEPHVNPGMAWSLLADWPTLVAVGTLLLIPLIFLAYWRWFRHEGRLEQLTFGCVLGGALGNGWDRLLALLPVPSAGGVRDFISIDLHPIGIPYHWPTFNVADIFITVGAITMVVFFGREEAADEAADEAPSPGDDEAPRAAKAPAGPAEEPTGPASTIPAPDVPPSEEPARDDPGGDPPARDDPPARERPAGDPSIGDEPEPARPGGGS